MPARLRRADAAARVSEAWRLRVEVGLTWAEIASAVGYANPHNAMRAVRSWRGSLPPLDVERLRDEAVARAEWLVRKAIEDVEQDRPGCVTAMVRAEARLASLLGLDAPSEIVLHNPTAAELERWVAAVTAAQIPDVVEADVVSGFELTP